MRSRISIVVFAQVPPPEHGQSRMVLLALNTLRATPESFEVHHVNARFSDSLEDIGESSLRKGVLIARYLADAIRLRFRVRDPLLYYVPGPVKWSAVIRDWVLLAILRRFYRRTVFHWHAIGQGEWAHGSERLRLDGPPWMDRVARRISARILDRPGASIAVSATSEKDSVAVSSRNILTVRNGIDDPCPDYEISLGPARMAANRELAESASPCFRILFISHGTVEKGLLDAVEALRLLMEATDPQWRFEVTFAGGVSEILEIRFERDLDALKQIAGRRLTVYEKGYVSGADKQRCYRENDILLAPSRWESFGLTVLEAMAHGMRVVAATSDGVKGVLPEDHPYLAPTAAPEELSAQLLRCCADLRSGNRAGEGPALRQRFLDSYQIKDFAENLTAAFLKLGSGQAASLTQASHASAIQGQPTKIHILAYLADQNPGHDRSFGISRMSQVVLAALQRTDQLRLQTVTSKTSQQSPDAVPTRVLPWGTRNKLVRLLTDHFHPLFARNDHSPGIFYFPKGYLPLLSKFTKPSVVTIHDTIIQYDEDHYPKWRQSKDYAYWAWMLKHTLRHANLILTVSESSKQQILSFTKRHRLPEKEIIVTYEPCLYEEIPQPVSPLKQDFVIHLASREPHKRTAQLVRWWLDAEQQGKSLPTLHLIGTLPPESAGLLASSHTLVKRPFLEDSALREAYASARALILPSEIEGFGLPALEAYYLGTPVCHVEGTSVGEVLSVATTKGRFSLESKESLFAALDEVMAMPPEEIYQCGIQLRAEYSADKVANRMIRAFKSVSGAR